MRTEYAQDSGWKFHIAISGWKELCFTLEPHDVALCDGRKLFRPLVTDRPKRLCSACQQKQREGESRAGD